MLEKIKALSEKYAEIEYRLSQPEVYGDIDSLTRLNRERRELEPIVLAYRRYLDCQGRHQEALELLQDRSCGSWPGRKPRKRWKAWRAPGRS